MSLRQHHFQILTFAPDGRNLWASRQMTADQSCEKSMAGNRSLLVNGAFKLRPLVQLFLFHALGRGMGLGAMGSRKACRFRWPVCEPVVARLPRFAAGLRVHSNNGGPAMRRPKTHVPEQPFVVDKLKLAIDLAPLTMRELVWLHELFQTGCNLKWEPARPEATCPSERFFYVLDLLEKYILAQPITDLDSAFAHIRVITHAQIWDDQLARLNATASAHLGLPLTTTPAAEEHNHAV